ncbi:sulfite exporter TauE/SafE family protein [Rosettibacter firmus]|uniref:sulfite exporter TauE/SafE family protein n=1 Tax=Rosettibacter firmus TaxID=3111522 RepID=UPI00336BE769
MFIDILLLVIISAFAGLLGSLVGIGGGIIIVPALTLIYKVPVHNAIAASLISVIATSIAGANKYVEQEITNIKLGMFLEISTTLGALLGALLALVLHGWILSIIFGLLVFTMAIYSYITRAADDSNNFNTEFNTEDKLEKLISIKDSFYDLALNKKVEYAVHKPLSGSFVSLLAGVGSGLLGIGGGIIKVAAMNSLMKVPMKVSVATSKFMIGVTAATSSTLYFLSGAVDSHYVAPVAIGTIAGATFGSSIMNKFKSRFIKLLFTAVAGYLSIRMILKGLSDGMNLNIF